MRGRLKVIDRPQLRNYENHQMTADSPHTRPVRREGRRRRQQILEATLRLIAREGVRAVRHRAVAAEAEVPLAATTYYFRDISQLLRDSFVYFAEQRAGGITAVNEAIVAQIQAAPVSREELAEQVAAVLGDYLLSQAGARDDRAIELAFRDEARRDDGLRVLNIEQERLIGINLEELLQLVGSTDPFADAQITLGVIYRLEAEAAFAQFPDDEVRRVVSRHVRHILGLVRHPMVRHPEQPGGEE